MVGLTSCMYAVMDIKSDVLDRPRMTSDAVMLAELTGVPSLIWGALWIGIALWGAAALFKFSCLKPGDALARHVSPSKNKRA